MILLNSKITPATRTEAAAEVSEFNFHAKKRVKSGKSNFREADLIRAIKKKKPQVAQKLEVSKKNKTLSKPLETVYEKKVQREVGFQNVKNRLDDWNDIVLSNRVADQLSFPLKSKQIDVYDHTDSDLFSSFGNLTPLEEEFNKVLKVSEITKEDQKKMERSKFRIMLKDMMEKRKTFAKAKAQASYQIAKARRQNKIKSKKYHRLLRREKTKQQLKDFELLKETDPDAALKQLEQLERSRAQERATLRHRNTGKWARNQIVKAKYDKESRQAISEQLAKNRELTEKKHIENSDSDSTDSEAGDALSSIPVTDSNNPWQTTANEYDQFVGGYKKFWKETLNESESDPKNEQQSDEEAANIVKPGTFEKDIDEEFTGRQSALAQRPKKKLEKSNRKKSKSILAASTMKKFENIRSSSGMWTVTSIPNSEEASTTDQEINVTELFNSLDKKLEQKLKQKFKEVQDLEINTTRQNKNTSTKSSNKKTSNKKRPNKRVIEFREEKQTSEEKEKPQVVNTTLNTAVPDQLAAGTDELDDDDEDASTQHKMTIDEAFVDEDFISEFLDEKKKEEEEDKPQLIDTSLPGWGSWTDASSIRDKDAKKPRYRRTNKRLLFRIPKAPPRKDANKGLVIIKEGTNDSLKEHLVSELPYPFTKVKDFEAHLRAPIGRTWLPETAHQQLIAPPIVTKLGTVIEPMDEGELVQREDLKN